MGRSTPDQPLQLIYYGTGLALSTVEIAPGVLVDLRREPINHLVWKAMIDVADFPDDLSIVMSSSDLRLDENGRFYVERSTPEEALSYITGIYKEYC